MTLQNGARLGPYEIVAPIGAGGMGEVFRAKDTRLDRSVAIKVLPSHLSSNPQLRERFDREARAISALNHPNICTLYDVGHQDGVDYIVMELLEGESLADRLAKGPLPLDQVLRYGAQIAEGLDRAHRQGIVHRDLKPGNVMITKSGAKLLDFGLARSVLQADASMSSTAFGGATEQKPLTQEGTILGTFQYMAPEQFAGETADARTDIFSLGAVLYEMLTGIRAFQGKNKTSLIGAIVSGTPRPINSLQPLTPPALEHVISRCLAKEPDDRWQSARDVAEELRWSGEAGSVGGATAPEVSHRGPRRYLSAIPTIIALLATAGFAYLWIQGRRELERASEPVRFSIFAPPGGSLRNAPGELSPDGRRMAMLVGKEGATSIWIRPIASGVAEPLAGTDGATFPFWSPDGRNLGFFADGKLKRIMLAGGATQILCDAASARGGSWSHDGTILFSPSLTGPLQKVPAAGGVATDVFPLDIAQNERSQRWPFFLESGSEFVYSSNDGKGAGIYLASLKDKTRVRLVDIGTSPGYAAGHLLFVRDSTLFAQRLDIRKQRLTGEPVAIAQQVTDSDVGRAGFSATEGALSIRRGDADDRSLTWLDRAGVVTGTVGPFSNYDHPDISPDGRFIAVDRSEHGAYRDLWLFDVRRTTFSRFTFDSGRDWILAWSPDGRQIAFTSNREGKAKIFAKAANGSGGDRRLVNSTFNLHHFDWSSDGRFIVAEQEDARGRRALWLFELGSGRRRPVVQSEFPELYPRISPDRRWLAYSSEETGRQELYVTSLTRGGGRWQITTEGGSGSRWRADGRELFYFTKGKMMSVSIAAGEDFEAGPPQLLFDTKLSFNNHAFDVTADGQRFLLPLLTERASSFPIDVTLNWASELKK